MQHYIRNTARVKIIIVQEMLIKYWEEEISSHSSYSKII